MTAIKATIFQDVEGWLQENLKDFEVDGVSAVYPYSGFTKEWSRTYFDEEENVAKVCSFEEHVKALRLLCELIDGEKLFVGMVNSAQELTDPCNWDVEVVDAYFQLIYHGEVIYG